MSLMTKATMMNKRPHSLRASVVIGLLAGVIGLTGLFLGHVQLRFKITDLKIEARSMQKQRIKLRARKTELASQLEELKSANRILDYARDELGMVAYDPASADTMMVDLARLKKWRECKGAVSETLTEGAERNVIAAASFDTVMKAFNPSALSSKERNNSVTATDAGKEMRTSRLQNQI